VRATRKKIQEEHEKLIQKALEEAEREAEDNSEKSD